MAKKKKEDDVVKSIINELSKVSVTPTIPKDDEEEEISGKNVVEDILSNAISNAGNSSDVLSKVVEAFATKRLIEDLANNKPKEENNGSKRGDSMDELMKFLFMKKLMEPDMQQLMLMEKLLSRNEKKDDEVSKILMQMMLQQYQTQQQLVQMFFQKEKEEKKSEINELKQKLDQLVNALNDRIDRLHEYVAYAQSQDTKQSILEQINEMVEFKKALEKAMDNLAGNKQPIVQDGKVNWNQVINKALEIGEKLVTRADSLTREIKPTPPPEINFNEGGNPISQPEPIQTNEVEEPKEELKDEDLNFILAGEEGNDNEVDNQEANQQVDTGTADAGDTEIGEGEQTDLGNVDEGSDEVSSTETDNKE